MGCGCGQGKSGRKNKNRNTITVIINRTTKPVPHKNKLTIIDLNDRKKKCSSCPFNPQKDIFGRCKKANRIVSRFIADANFHCPIKRF